MKTLCATCLLLLTHPMFASELAGTWKLSIDTPRGIQHPLLQIEKGEDGYRGTYQSLRGPIDIERIDRTGDEFSFSTKITVPIGEIEVRYSGEIDGDDMRGVVENPRGQVPFSGTRTAD